VSGANTPRNTSILLLRLLYPDTTPAQAADAVLRHPNVDDTSNARR
jgi:hypothetical protein